MFATKRVIRSMLCGIMVFGSVSFAGAGETLTLVVVPARQRLVKLGFDILKMRDCVLVAYDKTSTGGLLLHVWEGKQAEWVKISMDDVAAGRFTKGTPGNVIVIGDNEGHVAKLAEVATPLGNVQTIPTLNLVTVANKLNEIVRFSAGEWKYLAREYGMELKDLNEDVRRYGHYGKPGEKQQNVPLPEDSTELKPGPAKDVQPAPAPAKPVDIGPAKAPKMKAPEDK